MPLRRFALIAAASAAAACSVRSLAVDALGSALAEGSSVFASDDDPELVRDALPFALKTIEALLAQDPEDRELCLAACSGFTQYAYAFVEGDLDTAADYARAEELRDRAFRLYVRARDYGLRALEGRYPGIAADLAREPEAAARKIGAEDVDLAFWTGSAWASAIALALDRPAVVADLDAARALLYRTLALDPDFEGGSIHEVMIAVEALPAAMGGSVERAREHAARAIELERGRRAGPYVTLAVKVALPAQDRAEFEALLAQALAVDLDADPGQRLANRLLQRRARRLLEQADELFLDPAE